MAYAPIHFVDGVTPLNAATFNHMEDGIVAAEESGVTPGVNDTVPIGDSTVSPEGLRWDQIRNAQVAPNAAIARGKLAVNTVDERVEIRNPRATSLQGNSFFTVLGLTAWDLGHWEFARDVDGRVYGLVHIPPMAQSPFPWAPQIRLRVASPAVGVTRMKVATARYDENTSINPAVLVAETAVDVTIPTANFAVAANFPLTPVPVAGEDLIVEITHDGAHVNDTLAGNTWLLSAHLRIATY